MIGMVRKDIIITAFIFSVLINSCDSGNNNNPCWCETKNHLSRGEKCNCGADKGTCNCTEWVAYMEGIPIYEKGGGRDFVEIIFRAYSLLEPEEMAEIKNKVKEIHITPGNNSRESIIATVTVPEGIILEINDSSREYQIYMAFKYWVLSY
jgi:hypothetical protein